MSAGLGGLPARRPDQRVTGTSRAGVGPAPSNIGFFREVIISGPTGLLLVYSPAVGPGNLIAAIAGANGNAPPSGNPFIRGLGTYNEPSGVATVLDGGNIAWYYNVTSGRIYAFTAPQQLAPATVAPALRLGVGTGLMLGSDGNQAESIIFVVPSGDATGATDASNLVNALAFANRVVMIPGSWSIACGNVVATTNQWIDAAGCVIDAVGAGTGPVFQWVDSTTYTTRTTRGGGLTGWPVIDGTGTTGACYGVEAGDILGLAIDAVVQNFTGTGAVGAYFNNANFFCEQATVNIYAHNCTTLGAFDCTGATTSTGSFDRGDFTFYVSQLAGNQGIVFQNGAQIVGGRLRVFGNINTSASPLTTSILVFTGSTPAGHSPSVFSGLDCEVQVNVEADEGLANAPTTITFGAASNEWVNCSGNLNFGEAFAFTPATLAGGPSQFQFQGPIVGDGNLGQQSIFTRLTVSKETIFFGTVGMSGGGPVQPITANGQTILLSGVKNPIGPTAAFTGIILEKGITDGQLAIVVNTAALGSGFSVTFDVAATSNVADGTNSVIKAANATLYVWDDAALLWFKCFSI
jgi:hypothetical protein